MPSSNMASGNGRLYSASFPKSPFLIVTGVILFLLSFVRFFFGLSMARVFVGGMRIGVVEESQGYFGMYNLLVNFLATVVSLIASFNGMINWKEPLHARTPLILATLALVLGTAANLMQIQSGYGVSEFVWGCGVGAPALYFAAAVEYYIRSKAWMKQKRAQK